MGCHSINKLIVFVGFCFGLLSVSLAAEDQPDSYEAYVKNSRDFQRVKQDKDWAYKAFPSWTNMPWYYQWGIGHEDEGGEFSVKHGYNGAFLDHGDNSYLDWINKYKLRFYMDHTAGKGDLHLTPDKYKKELEEKLKTTGLRIVLLDEATKNRLKNKMERNINNVKSSPYREAYALDDEISWCSFVRPSMWRLIDDSEPYKNWLKEVYGEKNAPAYGDQWISYNDICKNLGEWSLKDFDCGQLMDQLTFNDAWWANFLGDLVEYSNSVDPEIPCGFVGGQSPNAFGGFDYARLMRKIQYLEAYNIGCSNAIVRSFNPHNGLPMVTAQFYQNLDDSIWQAWYYVAQGNRGFIYWVENWFDGKTPKDFHAILAPHLIEINTKIGPLQAKSEWIHDGVAVYYSHPSIQMSWILDAECHGGSWPNRNGDDRLGTSHLCRKAWINMLRDEGVQFSFISYADVIQNGGIPPEYKTLILPACYCLSDVEVKHIMRFVENEGTVIADFLPAVFDQHGRARKTGAALDVMFSVKHDVNMKKDGVFGGKLWVETDQEANFYYKTYEELMSKNDSIKDESGFNKAVRSMNVDNVNTYGKGTAVLMNLSPQWYNAYRAQGFDASKKREVFMKHVRNAGTKPWVRIENASNQTFGYEITYWFKDGRTILFLMLNPEVVGSSTGGGNSAGLKKDKIDATLVFSQKIKNVRDERADKALPDGDKFPLSWTMNEAVVLSFEGHPYAPKPPEQPVVVQKPISPPVTPAATPKIAETVEKLSQPQMPATKKTSVPQPVPQNDVVSVPIMKILIIVVIVLAAMILALIIAKQFAGKKRR